MRMLKSALAKIEAVMKKDNPAYPFNYQFVDDQFNQMFLNEKLISKLSRVFAALGNYYFMSWVYLVLQHILQNAEQKKLV